jgi:hypothetical protein
MTRRPLTLPFPPSGGEGIRFIRGVGPRVEEPPLALISFYPYSAPYEDLRLKP